MSLKQNIEQPESFAMPKENYKLIIIGMVIVFIGFILMLGGKAESPEVFNEEVFSHRRITIGPMVAFFGFIFQIWAIMRKPKTNITE